MSDLQSEARVHSGSKLHLDSKLPPENKPGSVREVFWVFLGLGLIAFGGPVAHVAHFHRVFVQDKKWLSEAHFAQIFSICQFLPGPASSQLGFSIGYFRSGLLGAIAAFLAFTLPSVVILLLFALSLPLIGGSWGVAAIHGLKVTAFVVVLHGLLAMVRQLCPDKTRQTIAVVAMFVTLSFNHYLATLGVIGIGAVLGYFFCEAKQSGGDNSFSVSYSTRSALKLFAVFLALLFLMPLVSSQLGYLGVFNNYFQTGSMVFGGGHVVLPLLSDIAVSEAVSPNDFLAGYGAVQMLPGPMFSFAAYLGFLEGGILNAVVALTGIFLPGFMLLLVVFPFWKRVSEKKSFIVCVAGINAAVVGLLGAALYSPIFIHSILSAFDVCTALGGYLLLAVWKRSVLWTILWCIAVNLGRVWVLGKLL